METLKIHRYLKIKILLKSNLMELEKSLLLHLEESIKFKSEKNLFNLNLKVKISPIILLFPLEMLLKKTLVLT
jgi:hypothetical protein